MTTTNAIMLTIVALFVFGPVLRAGLERVIDWMAKGQD